MTTMLENMSKGVLTLPPPFRGMLRPGQRIVVGGTCEDVIAAFGGFDRLRDLRVTEVNSAIDPFYGPYLSRRLWVDADTTCPDYAQNGSIESPFSTLHRAISFALGQAGLQWQFELVPSFAYAAEPEIELGGGRFWLFGSYLRSCLFPPVRWIPTGDFSLNPTTASILFFRNIQLSSLTVDGSDATDARFGAESCGFGPVLTTNGAGLTFAISGISNASFTEIASPVVSSELSATADFDRALLLLDDTRALATLRAGELFANSCAFADDIEVTGTIAEIGTSQWVTADKTVEFEGLPGLLDVDQASYVSYLERECATVNGTLTSSGVLISLLQTETWDGSAGFEIEILPANHPTGLYECKIAATILVPRAGLFTVTQHWSDFGSQSSGSANIATDSAGSVPIALGTQVFHSDGTGTISAVFDAFGSGPLSMLLRASVIRVG